MRVLFGKQAHEGIDFHQTLKKRLWILVHAACVLSHLVVSDSLRPRGL